MNKLPKPLIKIFQFFDLINDSNMWRNNQLNWMSLYLLNKLENLNLSINDIEMVNKILEINNFNEGNIK